MTTPHPCICGGETDNGIDRGYPPQPYNRKKCHGEGDKAVPEGQNHIAYAGKMVDVEALKFKVLLAVSPGGDHTEVSGAECLMIGKTIDHLYSAGYIREPLPRIEGSAAPQPPTKGED